MFNCVLILNLISSIRASYVSMNLTGDYKSFLLLFSSSLYSEPLEGKCFLSAHPLTSISFLPQSPRTQHQPSPVSPLLLLLLNNNKTPRWSIMCCYLPPTLPHPVVCIPCPLPCSSSPPHNVENIEDHWDAEIRDLKLTDYSPSTENESATILIVIVIA